VLPNGPQGEVHSKMNSFQKKLLKRIKSKAKARARPKRNSQRMNI
jgi:hypothetical protein